MQPSSNDIDSEQDETITCKDAHKIPGIKLEQLASDKDAEARQLSKATSVSERSSARDDAGH